MPWDSYQDNLPPAIVVGIDNITGLQTARILARHGIPVFGIAKDLTHFCCRTRVCQEILYADIASESFVPVLEQLHEKFCRKAVLIPCTDMAVLQISRYREQLSSWYHIALPEADVVEMLVDKLRFLIYANEHNLPIPPTAILRDRADAERAAEELSFPCILKPPIKTQRWSQNGAAKVYRVTDAEQLLSLYDRCSAWSDVLIVQEWIEGCDADLFSCNCYFNANSEAVVTFVARKLRQWPPEMGISCLREEIRNDTVLQQTLHLFKQVRYHGLGYLEMKRDQRTGKHYIIEPNIGRPTGGSAIAEAGGVDLVLTMYLDTVGLPLTNNLKQTYRGAKWVHVSSDLRSAFHYWRSGDLTVKDWWQSWQGRKKCAVVSRSDPGPMVAEARLASRHMFEQINTGLSVWLAHAIPSRLSAWIKPANDQTMISPQKD